MEDIVAYLFENSDDFKEGHYLTLMNLVNKAHKEQRVKYPIIPTVQYEDGRNYHVNRIARMSSSAIEVSDDQWIRLSEILNLNNVQIFVLQLDWIVPEDYQVRAGAIYQYRFVLPETLTSSDRQKLHVMSKVFRAFHTESCYLRFDRATRIWTKKLNIFIREF